MMLLTINSIIDPNKFDREGNAIDYYGNTVIEYLDLTLDDPDVIHLAKSIQSALKKQDYAAKLSFLPISSLHMTILSLIRDIDRGQEVWPSYLPDQAFAQIDPILKEKVDQVPFSGPIKMKIAEFSAFRFRLEPYDKDSFKNLYEYRKALVEETQVDRNDLDTYTFHITLAYTNRPFNQEEKADFAAFKAKMNKQVQDGDLTIRVSQPEFVIFNDMLAYHTDLSKRGDHY